MWKCLSVALVAAAIPLNQGALAQELRRPYTPFDAIAEGTERSESQRRSLIASQLDTVDQLRLTQVAGPRSFLRDSNVTAVYPYGRRGILGLRPRGYVVVRRAPVTTYRRSYAPDPQLYEPRFDSYGYSAPQAVRQPIGHELLRTGPNRWEYRPLYADDDRQLDDVHREIERELRPPADDGYAERTGYATQERRSMSAPRVNAPEELPEPQDTVSGNTSIQSERPSPRPGQARDIARDEAERRNNRPPPTPRPDPRDQPRNLAPPPAKQPAEDDEPRGPLLKDPASGTREF